MAKSFYPAAIALCACLALVAGEMAAAPVEVPEEKFIQEEAPAPDQSVLAAAAAHEAKLKAAVVAAKAQAASAKLAALQASQNVAHAKDTAKQHEKQSAKAPAANDPWSAAQPASPKTAELLSAWGEAPQAPPGSELIQEDDETHANPVAAAAAAREAKIKAQLLEAKAQAAAAKVAALKAAGDVNNVQNDIHDHKKAQAAEKAKAALAAWNGNDKKFDAGKAKASQFINNVWGAPPAHPKKQELPVALDALN